VRRARRPGRGSGWTVAGTASGGGRYFKYRPPHSLALGSGRIEHGRPRSFADRAARDSVVLLVNLASGWRALERRRAKVEAAGAGRREHDVARAAAWLGLGALGGNRGPMLGWAKASAVGRRPPPQGPRHAARGDGQDRALGRRTARPSCSAVAVAVENAAAWCLWGMGTATPRRTWPETGMLSGLPASKLSIFVRDGQAGSCYATAGRLFPLPWLAAASSLRRPSPYSNPAASPCLARNHVPALP